MPKRSRSGVVSRPARVVAPISVNGGIGSVTTFAPGADAERDRQLRRPPSRDRTSPRPRAAGGGSRRRRTRCAARGRSGRRRSRPCAPAPGRRSARTRTLELLGDDPGQADVLPRPGGPASSTWSSASPRAAAAWIEISSWAFSAGWPTNSSSRRGRSVASPSSSSRGCGGLDALEVGAGRADHRRDTFSAWVIRASGVSPGAPSSSWSISLRRRSRGRSGRRGPARAGRPFARSVT